MRENQSIEEAAGAYAALDATYALGQKHRWLTAIHLWTIAANAAGGFASRRPCSILLFW